MTKKRYLGVNDLTVHELKVEPKWFDEVKCGNKRFEIRKNDRNFQVGDGVFLKEWDVDHFTGDYRTFKITSITDYKQKKKYVVFGIEPVNMLTYEPNFDNKN